LRVGRADGKRFLHRDGGIIVQPEYEMRSGSGNVAKELVTLAVKAVGHDGLIRHQHLPQRVQFMALTFSYQRVVGTAFENVKAQMQAHSFGLAFSSHPVLSPSHARPG